MAHARVGLRRAQRATLIRPRLDHRAQALIGEAVTESPRSHGHLLYIALELAKVLLLLTTGNALLDAIGS